MSREYSYGARAVGLTCSPPYDPDVQAIKHAYAGIINKLNDMRNGPAISERARLFSIAITEAQAAQMWAVKAITWKDE
jgi:hypothetical protein